jgi:hypothetical protein
LAKFVGETVSDSNMRQSHDSYVTGTTELALATLGDATKNRNDPIFVAPPKVAKASKW